ncbi:MAG: DUF4350 domain-containing protein [Kiloniellaceae bacterium]
MSRDEGAFSFRAVGLLIAVGLLSFVAAALVAIFSDPQTEGTYGTNAYSYSAIGHKAWAEVLEDLGVPVVLSRNESATKAYYNDGLLILAQPNRDGDALVALEQLFETDRVLVVLPRWNGAPGYENRRWIKRLFEVDTDTVEQVLATLDEDATIVRSEGPQDWQGTDWDIQPTLDGAQLIKSERITPIVYSAAGVLLGEYRLPETTVWVLSDPGIVNNAGIDEGDNAAFAVAMVDAMLPPGSAAVFDETIHGFTVSPDLWQALLTFPLNLAVLQSVLAAAVLVWAAAGRFGAPLPPRPRLQAGKQVLIANTASLFEYAGNLADILRRYRETCLRDLARRLHIPRDIPRDPEARALVHWLNQVGDARGTTRRYSEINHEVSAAIAGPATAVPTFLRAAVRLYRWKQEMIHGHRADPDGLRPGPGAGTQDRGRTGRRP